MKALIYARCSTDDKKQDVEVQLKDLRRYGDSQGWSYDEVSEYGSGFKGDQPELAKCIEKIRLGYYKAIIVYSMDRFSRQSPTKVNNLLGMIVEEYKCRFISLTDNLDSNNELIWNTMRYWMVYFANQYSKQLGIKVKAGQRTREHTKVAGLPRRTR
jgi:DNA invertase Pin-like site-specific DNA recombinase